MRTYPFLAIALGGAGALMLAIGFISSSSAEPEGGYLDLQGPATGYMEVGHDPALTPTGAITVETWVYLYTYGGFGGTQTDCPLLIGKNWETTYGLGLACGGDISDGYINGVELPGTATIPLQTWTHLAMTYDGQTLRLYQNGQPDGTLDIPGPIAATEDPLRVGHDVSWDFTPNARIDDVRIWNLARTEGAIASTLPGVDSSAPGLIANWRFDGGSLFDRVSGRQGTLVGDAEVLIAETPTPVSTDSPTPTATAEPTPAPTATGVSVPAGAKGDIDCDQTIGPADVVALLGHLAGVAEAPGPCEATASGVQAWLDMECSGAVDTGDALVVLAHFGGVDMVPIVCLPIGATPTPVPTPSPSPA